MSTMIDQLQTMRAQIDKLIAAAGGEATTTKTKVTKKAAKAAKAENAEKKPRANAGQGTAWSAFSSKIQADHKEELDAVKAAAAIKRKAAKDAGEDAPKDTQGAHLHWCSTYKAEHEAEWLAFKAQWEAEHPKSTAATPAASPDGKVKAERTPEEKAAAAAKRAATKAAKDAKKAEEEAAARAASVAEAAESDKEEAEEEAAAEPEDDAKSTSSSAEEEASLSLMPVTIKKVNYLRLGKLGEDEEVEWDDAGDVWLALADGTRGAHAGIVNSAGKVVPAPAGHEVPNLT